MFRFLLIICLVSCFTQADDKEGTVSSEINGQYICTYSDWHKIITGWSYMALDDLLVEQFKDDAGETYTYYYDMKFYKNKVVGLRMKGPIHDDHTPEEIENMEWGNTTYFFYKKTNIGVTLTSGGMRVILRHNDPPT